MGDSNGSIRLWVSTFDQMNSGRGEGAWIQLPMDKDELEEILPEAAHAKSKDDEIGIFDCDVSGDYKKLGLKVSEYDSIRAVNALAKLIEESPSVDLDVIGAYVNEVSMGKPMDYVNAILQFDEIRFTPFDNPPREDWTETQDELQRRFGDQVIHEALSELAALGDKEDTYFISNVLYNANAQTVGEAASVGGILTQSGFLDLDDDLNFKKYSLEEVEEMVFGDEESQEADLYDSIAPDVKIDSWEHTDSDTYLGSVEVDGHEIGFVLNGASRGDEAGDVEFYGCHNGAIYFTEEPNIPSDIEARLDEISDKIRVGHSFEPRGDYERGESLDEMMNVKATEAEIRQDMDEHMENSEQERE